jgi:hypothetical protein
MSKKLHWSTALYGVKLDTSESGSEIPGKSRKVVLEKDEEDQLDRSCKK